MTSQVEYWNGPAGQRWAAHQAEIDRSLAAITDVWLAAVPATASVLDVGCGCGTTTRLLAGRGARAVGVDVSAPMLAVARAAGGAEFVEADAGTHAFGAFELIASRFGVMFFADPLAAFANLRTASARLAFVCWREPAATLWATVPMRAAGELVPPLPPADPTAPGARSPLADAARLADILARAGFAGVTIERRDSAMRLGDTLDQAVAHVLTIGPLARAAAELPADTQARIAERVRGAVALEMAASVWLVTA